MEKAHDIMLHEESSKIAHDIMLHEKSSKMLNHKLI